MPRNEIPDLIKFKASESFNRRNIINPPTFNDSFINSYMIIMIYVRSMLKKHQQIDLELRIVFIIVF